MIYYYLCNLSLVNQTINRYANSINNFIAIMNRNNRRENLSVEIKTKIITLRNSTCKTFEEIAAECGCNVRSILLL